MFLTEEQLLSAGLKSGRGSGLGAVRANGSGPAVGVAVGRSDPGAPPGKTPPVVLSDDALVSEANELRNILWDTTDAIKASTKDYGTISLVDRANLYIRITNPLFNLITASPVEKKMLKLSAAVRLGYSVIHRAQSDWFGAGKQSRLMNVNPSLAGSLDQAFNILVSVNGKAVDAQSNLRMDKMSIAAQSVNIFYKDIAERLEKWGRYVVEDLPKQLPDIGKYLAIGAVALAALFVFTKSR